MPPSWPMGGALCLSTPKHNGRSGTEHIPLGSVVQLVVNPNAALIFS